jgi:glycosyltransferase involved in cell wall biosynthesis
MTNVLPLGLVSIVVPSYNAERFLADTLESAFAQTYSRTEVIVIDDGSTDGTAALIRSYGRRLRAEFGPNRGVSAARNLGTALARGEFIQYLDADDLLFPDSIERRVTALQEAGADVAYSDWEKLIELPDGKFEVGERVSRCIEDMDSNPILARLKFWAPPVALTYRRTITEKIGSWKEWLPIIQDARFLQDASLVGGQFVYVPGVGATYRMHSGASLSRGNDRAFVLDVFRNGCDLQSILETKGAMNTEMRHNFARFYDYIARSLFFHDQAAFHDSIARLYKLDPSFQLTWPKVASFASQLFGFKTAGMMLSLLTRLRSVDWKTQRYCELDW